jgi:hypothetical protein
VAKIPKKAAANIIFGNKERKQFPEPEGLERAKPSSAIEGPTQPLGFGYRLRSKFSEQVSEIDLEKKHKEDMLPKGMRQTFASRSNKRPKHLQHPAPVRGGQYRSTPQMERPHYEETEKMTDKTFNQFMTEAKKAGRPKKLKPGEEADTLHIQDQLSKLTHPNHVEVHFKDNTKHDIPRVHANKALQHLASLKPIERADHADHMGKSHSNFYHVLSKKSIPTKSKGISLAGPKLRKEEVELDESTRDKLQRYVQGAKPERRDPVKGEKRRAGVKLALKKIVGSDELGRKPKVKATNEEIEYTAEEIELYDSLSEEHKAIFEKMDREELNKLMKSYKGKITKGEYNQPRESEKPWPASKMKGSKWASTAGSIMRKNQGYKK